MNHVDVFEKLRPRLAGVAYSMLGSLAEAEDVVQDAWLRFRRAELEEIDDVTGWLITVTSRLAVDVLRSARRRREDYVGPWLPEPVEVGDDPADTVSLTDSMSWAMLVVLETLGPSERAAFVLHDVFGLPFDEVGAALGKTAAACRQAASRARRHVEERRPRFTVDEREHRAVVDAFAAATVSGRLDDLLAVLHPDAVLTADGGPEFRAARHPIVGAGRVARFLSGVGRNRPVEAARSVVVNHNPALLLVIDGEVDGIVVLGIADARVRTIDHIRNRAKFTGVRIAAGPTDDRRHP